MIPIQNEKRVPKYLCDHAREYCEKVGSDEIHNICCLGEGDYRIMYFLTVDGKRKMEAVILKIPAL